MYTLILLFSLMAASPDGGVALHSQQIPGFAAKAECEAAGKGAVQDLMYRKNLLVITASCVKVK